MAEDPDVPDGESDDVPEPRRSRRGIVIAVSAAALVIVLGAVVFISRSDSGPDRSTAIALCREKVKAKLRSPATAKFDTDKPVDVSMNESGSGAGNLLIGGTVDAENGFSALIRNTYICVAHPDGDGWAIGDDEVVVL
jgi:hypothetical protein